MNDKVKLGIAIAVGLVGGGLISTQLGGNTSQDGYVIFEV